MVDQTLQYYEDNAADFVSSTAGVDLSSTLERFLAEVPVGGKVLDWGCGSGRDSAKMLAAGYSVTSVDGSQSMCDLAAERIGHVVICQRFQDLDAISEYDGIWACASLLHVPYAELGGVLSKAARALKPHGVLYMSFKYGDFEGVRNGRWFTDLTEESLPALIEVNGLFDDAGYWLTPDVRPGRGSERWLNCLTKRR